MTGVLDIGALLPADETGATYYLAGNGIASGTMTTITKANVSSHSFTLSKVATATGEETLYASDPSATADPDLLLASTYGEGGFAINLAPMLFPTTVGLAQSDNSGTAADGSTIVATATPTIDGESEISGFGSTTLGIDRRRDSGRLNLRPSHRRVQPADVR